MPITYTIDPVFAAPGAASPITSSTIAAAVGDLITPIYGVDENNAGTLTISNTGTAITWTSIAITNTANECKVAAWRGVVATAGNITVSVANSAGSTNNNAKGLYTIVHKGAHATTPVPAGNIFSGVGGTDISQAMTPTAPGSCIWMIGADWNATNTFAAIANCTLESPRNDAGQYTLTLIRPTTQPRADGAAFTIGETDTSGKITWLAFEVQAAAASAPFPPFPPSMTGSQMNTLLRT